MAELWRAAQAGDESALEKAIASKADVNFANADANGYTPMCAAAKQGHTAALRMLLEAGAEPDLAETYYGAGPLGWAAYYGKRELVALLLEFGASKDKRDFSGASALDSASTDEIRALLR